MSEELKVTSVTTGRDGVQTFWYNGAEPVKRKPPVNKGGYRRDPQVGRLYQAEREAFLGPFDETVNRSVAVDLPELGDVERYVAKVARDRWFRRHFGARRFRVTDGRGMHKAMASGGGRTISVSRRGRCRWVVLHEVAHCLASGHVQHHGPEFVAVYLKLVRHFLGRGAWRSLYDACRAHKVKMQKRRRRANSPMTDEQRALLVARLADARAAKALSTTPATEPG